MADEVMASEMDTHATTEAGHGGEVHAEPMALGFDATMLVALAMIVVIAFAIWKKVPALIGSALDRKIGAIREQLDTATKLREEAEALKAEYEAKAKQAAKDADNMRAAAVDEAKLIVSNAKKDAKEMIVRRSRVAEEKIAAAEAAAIAEVQAKAALVSAAAAEMLIVEANDAKADAAIVDAAIATLN